MAGSPRRIPALIVIFSILLFILAVHEGYYNIFFKKGRTLLREGKIDEAIIRLEQSKKLIYPRDLPLFLSDSYHAKYRDTKDKNWLSKEEILLHEGPKRDAETLYRIGMVNFERGDVDVARHFLGAAIAINPKNELKYYYQFFLAHKFSGGIPQELIEKTNIKALLAEYSQALSENRLYTVKTENPKYASRIFDILGMKKEEEAFDQLWFQELVKYSIKYGAAYEKSADRDQKSGKIQ